MPLMKYNVYNLRKVSLRDLLLFFLLKNKSRKLIKF